MSISLNNEQRKIELSQEMEDRIFRLIETFLAEESLPDDMEINILLSDDEQIRKLNKEFRAINEATDVLSFAYLEDDQFDDVENPFLAENILGDIIISLERAEAQRKTYGHSLERELAFLVVHGLYHLLGYNHLETEEEKIMRQKEEKLLSLAGFTR